jgi:hypothetical protein
LTLPNCNAAPHLLDFRHNRGPGWDLRTPRSSLALPVTGYQRCERTSDLTSKQRAIALPDDEHVAWVPDERERIWPILTGGKYVNSHLSEDDSDSTAA